MDNEKLTELLRDSGNRRFWIKPWGSQKFPDQPDAQPGTQFFAASTLDITFSKSKNPPDVEEGDILLVYHVRMPHMDAPKLVCVTEACSSPFFATTEQLKAEAGQKWPWNVRALNLTPAYGAKWSSYALNPFRLAQEFNGMNPSAKVTLGAINFGATKLRIREDFAKFLLKEIIRIV